MSCEVDLVYLPKSGTCEAASSVLAEVERYRGWYDANGEAAEGGGGRSVTLHGVLHKSTCLSSSVLRCPRHLDRPPRPGDLQADA